MGLRFANAEAFVMVAALGYSRFTVRGSCEGESLVTKPFQRVKKGVDGRRRGRIECLQS